MFALFREFVMQMCFLYDLDGLHNLRASEKPNHVTHIVGTHTKTRIVRDSSPTNLGRLQRLNHRLDHRAAVGKTGSGIQLPINLRQIVFE